jgi:hypothetical protein
MAYCVEKLGFGAAALAIWAYEPSTILRCSAEPIEVEIAPGSLCVTLKAIGDARAHCDSQLGLE